MPWIYVWTSPIKNIYVWTTPVKEVYVWDTRIWPEMHPFTFVGSTQGNAINTPVPVYPDTPLFYSFTQNWNRILVVIWATVKEYSLGTAYDLTSATLVDSKTVSLNHDVRWWFIGDWWKKIYFIWMNSRERVYYFSKIVSTDWTVSWITWSATMSASLASYNYPQALCYSEDGTKLYLWWTSNIHEFTQATPRWIDLSNYVWSKTSAISSNSIKCAMRIDRTWTKVYWFSASWMMIFQWTLSTPRDITSYTKDYEAYAWNTGYANWWFDFNNKNECILLWWYNSNKWWVITSW